MSSLGPVRTIVVGLLALVASAPTGTAQEDPSKDLNAIAEEQLLLRRQLQRLRQTMEILLPRLEAEGRTHALQLLKEGIEFLGDRRDTDGSLTIEELMDEAREAMARGQLVQSLEQQQRIVDGLTRLLGILMDRENLEALEESLDDLRQLTEQLAQLSDREARIEAETAQLRESSKTDAQRALERTLDALREEQAQLLADTEKQGRESGTLALEQLMRSLRELSERQRVDAEVLGGWKPEELGELAAVEPELLRARRAATRAERLEQAAASLRSAAQVARPSEGTVATPGALRDEGRALEQAAETEARHARASGDETAARTAEALRGGAEELRAAGTLPEELAAAADALEERARELEELAQAEAGDAREARAQAQEALEELAESTSGAGRTAAEVRAALEAAARAAEASNGPSPEAARATEEAGQRLAEGLDRERALGPVMSGSQARQAEATERVARGLEALPATEDGDAERLEGAREALDRAAEAMRATSAEARAGESDAAERSAQEGAEALAEALEALDQEARERAAGAQAASGAEPAEAQQELARATESARESARAASQDPESSMSPSSAQSAEEALQRASEAMQRAAEAMRSGQTASATSSQREAQEALDEAKSAVEDGTRPSDPGSAERAAELAAEQAAIERELLELARFNEERKNSQPNEALQRAGQSAGQAAGSLEQGDLGEAQQQEQETREQIDQALEQLQEEEEQYKRLRQEELLFRIAEEVASMMASHAEAMAATREVDASREPGAAPTRAQKLRLRRIATDQEALGERAAELADAIGKEGTVVFAELLSEIRQDFERIAERMGQVGGYLSGERVQSLQQDVAENLAWLAQALDDEQRRRAEEEQQGQGQGQQDQQQNTKNQLVPDVAELKLLRRMEVETLDRLRELASLYPELVEGTADDPLLLEDVGRLAERHERTSVLFGRFRERLGVPDPELNDTSDEESEDGGP